MTVMERLRNIDAKFIPVFPANNIVLGFHSSWHQGTVERLVKADCALSDKIFFDPNPRL